MKILKLFFITSLILIFSAELIAQVPQELNYQAVLRDNTNNEISDAPITVRIALMQDSPSGTLLWEEEHDCTTNDFGMFNLLIGDPGATNTTNGTLSDFAEIAWGDYPVYIGVSVYYDGSWKDFGARKLNSVPYARISETSLDNPFSRDVDTIILESGKFSVGSPDPGTSNVGISVQNTINDEALFEVKRPDGITVFAVYSEGVRIFLPTDPETKGVRGGFAVAGFDKSNKADITEDYLWVTPDSIRMYFDKTPEGKGVRGGFAVGGFDRSPDKGSPDDMMLISADSTRFYIDDTYSKGPRGGFAVAGFDRNPDKGLRYNYMRVTTDSTRFFVRDSTAGFGISNIESGEPEDFLKIDKRNYFIGHQSGINTIAEEGAVYNSFIGYKAGTNNTTGRKNVFLGFRSGENNKTGFLNVFLGNQSGLANDDGYQNIFIGEGSGMGNVSGDDNVFIGINSGQYNDDGNHNIYIGPQAGQYSINQNSNIFLGYQAGGLSAGSGNIFIGTTAGMYDGRSQVLAIENNTGKTSTPLISGDFSDGNRSVHINGTFTATEIAKSSDLRLKRNIESLAGIMPLIMQLKPVSFLYKTDRSITNSLPEGMQFGLVAQDLELIFPELVLTDKQGYKSIDYMSLSSLLLPAVQELKTELDKKEASLEALQNKYTDLENRLNKIENQIVNK